MKLEKSTESIQEFSELDMLRIENEFLQDELEFQELNHSLELIETIKDCIRKEGGVSSSLEIMFGENFSSSANALNELNDILSQSYEGMFDKIAESMKTAVVKEALQSLGKKLLSLTAESIKDVSFPITVRVPRRSQQWEALLNKQSRLIEELEDANDSHLLIKMNEQRGKIPEIIESLREIQEESQTIDSADEFIKLAHVGGENAIKFSKTWKDIQKDVYNRVKNIIARVRTYTGQDDVRSEIFDKDMINDILHQIIRMRRITMKMMFSQGRAFLNVMNK